MGDLSPFKPIWGDIITFQHTNQWGELCGNIYEYTYAGSRGKYPDYTHRFARIGDASIANDSFEDLFLWANKCVVGEKFVLGLIKSLTRAPQWPPLKGEHWQSMFQVIEDSMWNHYMCDVQGEDGEPYRLVDMLTPDTFSIDFGKNEIHMIVDDMYHDIKKHLQEANNAAPSVPPQ